MTTNRSSWLKASNALIFIFILLAGLFAHFSNQLYSAIMALALLGLAIFFLVTNKPLFGPSLFFFMTFLTTMLPFPVVRLGMFLIVPIAIYAILLWIFPSLQRDCRWFYRGVVDKYSWVAGLIIAAISSTALYLWVVFAKPNLNDLLTFIPNQSFGALLIVGIGFALVNSVVEESIYRGILWTAFGAIFKSVVAVTLLQAAIFGVAHIQGFPRGAVGVVMAFVYGIMLGWLRHRSKGLLAPMIIHFVADLTIYLILIHLMEKLQYLHGSGIIASLVR
jgi:uncharacterized protein